MGWAFEDPDLCSRLHGELESWRGTPFFPESARKGVGVDCFRFPPAVLAGIGLVTPINWPRYSIRGGGEELLAVIEERLAQIARLVRVWSRGMPAPSLRCGDLLLFSNRMSFHHLGLADSATTFWHALERLGVRADTTAHVTFAKYLHVVYRITDK